MASPCVPSRGRQPLEHGFPRRLIVEVKRLRIVFGRERLDLVLRDLDGAAFEPHAQGKVFEPFDHIRSSNMCRETLLK